MSKKYQTKTIDTNALAVPEQVGVAMGELTADLQEGLLALAAGTGCVNLNWPHHDVTVGPNQAVIATAPACR